MPKRIGSTLRATQERELGEAINHDKRPQVRQRALAISLLACQEPPKEIAGLMEVSQVTVYNWWHRYTEADLAGLANQPKGRPQSKADAGYLAALEVAIATNLSELGYDFAIWSVARLRDHLALTTGVQLSVDHLALLMRRQGYIYRRPKHTLQNL